MSLSATSGALKSQRGIDLSVALHLSVISRLKCYLARSTDYADRTREFHQRPCLIQPAQYFSADDMRDRKTWIVCILGR